jgi:glycerate-2-kinase
MLEAVRRTAKTAGLLTKLLPIPITGEAHTAVRQLTDLARSVPGKPGSLKRPCCVVAGGETTVTVTGRGKGGRAQEFAASAALEIAGLPNTWIVALGTDGTDGPTDAAGAIVSGGTVPRAKTLGIDLRSSLDRHNTYPALKAAGCHIHTGPTGTNVNDLYLLLLL